MNTFITSSTSSIEKQIRGLPEESGIYTYGYDEFGQDLYRNQGQIQPFGYTGYQSDRIAETYYAQAREYRAELGRFAGWISSRDLQRHRIKILSPDSLKYKKMHEHTQCML